MPHVSPSWWTEYRKAPEVTRERLYLETMETVLGNTRKVLIDSENSNNLLYMPLDGNARSASSGDIPTAQLASPFVSNSNETGSSGMRQSRNLQPGNSREER
ncbi:MAG: hypothetical protein R3E95_13555 [Thiolinea sp.]